MNLKADPTIRVLRSSLWRSRGYELKSTQFHSAVSQIGVLSSDYYKLQCRPNPPAVRTVRTYVITPRPCSNAKQQVHMSVWDTVMLGFGPIQKGLLFKSPPDASREDIIGRLKDALEEALFHFYPLAGRMRSVARDGGGVTCHVEVGGEGEGAEFVHAVVDGVGTADVVGMEGQDLPEVLKEFSPLNSAINVDGSIPLLSVQHEL